jgi:serine/threonine protein phosphatase PrpC
VRLDIGARTDVGRVRENNEDSYRLVPELGLFVLSDGMGGEAHGEMASRISVETLVAHCREATQNPALALIGNAQPELSRRANRLASAVRTANRAVHLAAEEQAGRRGMGATVVAIWLEQQRLALVHVGDSRAYLLRAGQLEQLTQDHSLVAEQVRSGVLTEEQASQSEMQSVLTRALGADSEVEVDAAEHLLLEDDTLLMCSDGLTRMVSDETIAERLRASSSAQRAADRLVELANDAGGADNITAVVLRAGRGSDGLLAKLQNWLFG